MDDERRALERRAAGGDQEAEQRLKQVLARAGESPYAALASVLEAVLMKRAYSGSTFDQMIWRQLQILERYYTERLDDLFLNTARTASMLVNFCNVLGLNPDGTPKVQDGQPAEGVGEASPGG